MIFLLKTLLFSIAQLSLCIVCAAKSYDRYALVSITCQNEDHVSYMNFLEETEAQSGTYGLQFWTRPQVNRPCDIVVSPNCLDFLITGLTKNAIPYRVKESNFQKLIDKDRMQNSQRSGGSRYLSLNDTEEYLKQMKAKYPEKVSLIDIGRSHENRSLWVIKVGRKTQRAVSKKPAIWMDAGTHAREWIAPATVLYIITKLIENSTLDKYISRYDWYFLPVLNPDGYHYTHTTDRLWRKNRRRGSCKCIFGKKSCCDGVDLNRNFGYEWGGVGASRRPCEETYGGPEPFSEPETRSVRDFLLQHNDTIQVFITLHSYAQVWTYPYGDRRNSYTDNYEQLDALSKKAVRAIYDLHETKYQVGTAANIMYPTAGGAADWVKAVAKIKYVFGVELRPDGRSGLSGFIVPPSEISDSGEEMWAALRTIADELYND